VVLSGGSAVPDAAQRVVTLPIQTHKRGWMEPPFISDTEFFEWVPR
jgi:hypothetical protein